MVRRRRRGVRDACSAALLEHRDEFIATHPDVPVFRIDFAELTTYPERSDRAIWSSSSASSRPQDEIAVGDRSRQSRTPEVWVSNMVKSISTADITFCIKTIHRPWSCHRLVESLREHIRQPEHRRRR